MDKKLEEYRRNKRRQAIINNFKEKLYNMVSFQQVKSSKPEHVIVEADNLNEINNEESDKSKLKKENDDICNPSDTESIISTSTLQDDAEAGDTDSKISKNTDKKTIYLKYLTYLVYFLLWITCYAIAIQLKFGTVYFLFSALFGVYFNTRTGPKPKNEISAYSVFNKNCEAIDGTISADQFERELRYGAVKM